MTKDIQNYLIDKNSFENFQVDENDLEDFYFSLDTEISENEILVFHNE
jgi:hypothetical protein